MEPTAHPTRVLLYSHDSQGLGHVRRNVALAHALAQHLPGRTGRGVTGMLLTGLDGIGATLPAGFDVVSLPGIHKAAGGYAPRHVEVPMDDLIRVRRELLSAVALRFRPDLVVVDRHPYGVDNELRKALWRLRRRQPGTRIVLGLREVLDQPEAVAREWAAVDLDRFRHTFDEIWVYGDPAVHDLRTSGELPERLHDMVRFTGYLSTGRWTDPGARRHPRPYVVTMVGGGSDGDALCRAAAAAPVPPGHRHLVVTGPQMDEQAHEEVRALATPDTEVVRRVDDGLRTIRGAAAVVAMAGYNTVTELLSTSVPGLLVPRERPRLEQAIRARALARTGAVDTVSADAVTPELLGRWLAAATGRRVLRRHLDRDGLAVVAGRAAELVPAAPGLGRAAAIHRTDTEQEPSRAV